ncbi:MAG TPA: hypothetical protein VJ840_10020 [Gemmatimonadaceae bacterium]|nr:hypothetical protein [Gemmatimonadaceae bacterium]
MASSQQTASRLGTRLRENVEHVVERYVTRMRKDPQIPLAADLPTPMLEDHAMTFLGDLFQTLVVHEEADQLADRDESELLNDGTRIQHLISELHGRQRHRVGWTEAALEREYDIFTEEVEALARRHGSEVDSGVPLESAIGVLRRHLDRARKISLKAYATAASEAKR